MNKTKIAVVGPALAGKTTLVDSLCGHTTPVNYTPTCGVNVSSCVRHNRIFEFWDCAGQPELEGLVDSHYLDTDLFIIVVDVSRQETIKEIYKYRKRIESVRQDNVHCMVVFNKYDIKSVRYASIVHVGNKLQCDYVMSPGSSIDCDYLMSPGIGIGSPWATQERDTNNVVHVSKNVDNIWKRIGHIVGT